MGELTAPGCLAGSIGAPPSAKAAAWASVAATGRGGAGANTACTWRATRTRWPSRSNSISVRPVSSSSRASSRMSSWSIPDRSLLLRSPATGSALAPRADQRGQPVDRQRIALDAEAAERRPGDRRDVREVAEALAREDVADMDFDQRNLDRRDRVADRDRGVGVAGRVEHDAGGLLGARLLDPVDQLALVVRLAEHHGEAVAFGRLTAEPLHVLEGCAAVGFRLARAEQIEVGAVEDVDGARHGVRRPRGCPALYGPRAQRGSAVARAEATTGQEA